MDGPRGNTIADNNFTLSGGRAVSDTEISLRSMMAVCLTENDRRFAGYDHRLLRPTTTPAIARLVTWAMSPRDWFKIGR
jgi:hypothetical protein